MSIRPDYLTFDNLLQNRLFRIPKYQRAYSWETKQRKDLVSDLKKLQENTDNEKHHFMATIVCLKIGRETIIVDEFDVFHVVDGQQRLTTLIIILKALHKALREDNEEEQEVARNTLSLLIGRNNRPILLQTNHDDSDFFRNYLIKGTIPESETVSTSSTKHLVEAFEECENFVKEWYNKHQEILSLLRLLKNRLGFIFYLLEDEGAAYTVFEVLNSRGLEVDWLDKCKTMLMGIAFETTSNSYARDEDLDELHKLWGKIYRTIGVTKIPGHEVLRFAATLESPFQPSRIINAEKAIAFFRDVCQKDSHKIIEVTNCFLKIAEILKQLHDNRRIEAIIGILHVRLLAVSILLKSSLNPEERQTILKQWENVTFRIYGIFYKDSRTQVGEYTRLAWKIIQEQLPANTLIAEVSHLGRDYPIKEAIEELRETDCYHGWESELRYFLYRYEEYLSHQQGSAISKEIWQQIWKSTAADTIEHILPQSTTDQQDHVHRLGNLTLLPPRANARAGQKSFQQKREIYRANQQLKLMNEIINQGSWGIREIEEREDRLWGWAINEWY